eukprot:COSAG02_NODE_601_length_19715_cov_445.701315_10_plen_96_part_00
MVALFLPCLWVGIVWSMEKSLINTVRHSDHLESLLFLADLSLNWRCFAPVLRVARSSSVYTAHRRPLDTCIENSLRNTVYSVDHLESRHLIEDQY